jgi:3-oxoacyl-[acyl-carrier-protein] synthase-3
MIYADGAGATLLEATDQEVGIISHLTRSDTYDKAWCLWLGNSYKPERIENDLFIKMKGHELYKYAVRNVPAVVKKNLERAGIELRDVQKVLIHQANGKMDDAILKRLFKLYDIKEIPADIMPMTISWLGNSSVATLPTLLDLIHKGKLENHRLHSGDIALFASVGAGMNINSMIYRVP